MKIALCQVNPTLGDFLYNYEKILAFYQQAISKKADLVVFPELSITGYPPLDLLLESSFIQENIYIANRISERIGEIPVILGFIRQKNSFLFNSAALIKNKNFLSTYDKILLPTYDVFDEVRYFTPGNRCTPVKVELNQKVVRMGLQICEDLWDDGYKVKVTDEMCKQGAELIINISASPYSEGKRFEREELIRKKVDRFGIPFLYCNLVGSQDELIFDGLSFWSILTTETYGKSNRGHIIERKNYSTVWFLEYEIIFGKQTIPAA